LRKGEGCPVVRGGESKLNAFLAKVMHRAWLGKTLVRGVHRRGLKSGPRNFAGLKGHSPVKDQELMTKMGHGNLNTKREGRGKKKGGRSQIAKQTTNRRKGEAKTLLDATPVKKLEISDLAKTCLKKSKGTRHLPAVGTPASKYFLRRG